MSEHTNQPREPNMPGLDPENAPQPEPEEVELPPKEEDLLPLKAGRRPGFRQ